MFRITMFNTTISQWETIRQLSPTLLGAMAVMKFSCEVLQVFFENLKKVSEGFIRFLKQFIFSFQWIANEVQHFTLHGNKQF